MDAKVKVACTSASAKLYNVMVTWCGKIRIYNDVEIHQVAADNCQVYWREGFGKIPCNIDTGFGMENLAWWLSETAYANPR